MPSEYVEYKLCRIFRCLPEDLDRMEKRTLDLWKTFMRLESEAASMRAMQDKFYKS